jgi:hypothetical protein
MRPILPAWRRNRNRRSQQTGTSTRGLYIRLGCSMSDLIRQSNRKKGQALPAENSASRTVKRYLAPLPPYRRRSSRTPCAAMTATSWCSALPSRRTRRHLLSASGVSYCELPLGSSPASCRFGYTVTSLEEKPTPSRPVRIQVRPSLRRRISTAPPSASGLIDLLHEATEGRERTLHYTDWVIFPEHHECFFLSPERQSIGHGHLHHQHRISPSAKRPTCAERKRLPLR